MKIFCMATAGCLDDSLAVGGVDAATDAQCHDNQQSLKENITA